MKGSPHGIAVGAAAGVFAAFLPVPGAQMLIAALLAWALRGSMLAALAGTFVGMPWTYPFIWLASHQLGQALLGDAAAPPPGPDQLAQLWPVLKPLALGGTLLGLAAGALGYALARRAVAAYQARARTRIAPRTRPAAESVTEPIAKAA
jgi:hypothetical protein